MYYCMKIDSINIFKYPFFIVLVIVFSLLSLAFPSRGEAFSEPTSQEFRSFIEKEIWPHVRNVPISRKIFNQAFENARYLSIVKKLQERQPEFTASVKAYLDKLVSKGRIKKGLAKKAQYESILDALEVMHMVDRHVVLAIWGIETNYGHNKGKHDVFSSLATMVYLQKRKKFAITQIIYALKIIRDKHISASNMKGSWAAAMGHTQFIPSSYDQYAIDFDGDRKKNIWESIPDALASTANYLKKFGWDNTIPWGMEVTLPKNFDYTLVGLRKKRPLSYWRQKKIRRANAKKLPNIPLNASLILPMGSEGVAFLVTSNFKAIMRYNNSVSYALAVSLLADNLKGQGKLYGTWPNHRYRLSSKQIRQVQQLLENNGYDTKGVDGIFGTGSQEALRQYQHDNNLVADGYPDHALLNYLKKKSMR